MFCVNCGADISENDRICPSCGAPIGVGMVYDSQINENELANLATRARAFVRDMGILIVLFLLMSIFLWGLAKYVLPVAAVAYYTVTVSGRLGATWGMASCRLKVVNAKDGEGVSVGIAFIRAILTFVFVPTLLFLVRNKEGRRLNDIITGTMVIVQENIK